VSSILTGDLDDVSSRERSVGKPFLIIIAIVGRIGAPREIGHVVPNLWPRRRGQRGQR